MDFIDQIKLLSKRVEQIKEQDINELKKFHKANFDVDAVFSAAEDLKYTNQIKLLLKRQLNHLL